MLFGLRDLSEEELEKEISEQVKKSEKLLQDVSRFKNRRSQLQNCVIFPGSERCL